MEELNATLFALRVGLGGFRLHLGDLRIAFFNTLVAYADVMTDDEPVNLVLGTVAEGTGMTHAAFLCCVVADLRCLASYFS